MESCLYTGSLRHRRFSPVPHHFDYPIFMFYLDLDELDSVFDRRLLWSARRAAIGRFRREDHLGNTGQPLGDSVRDLIGESGVRPAGPIRLLTQLRYFGYGFNPVSFYYCFNESGNDPRWIVAEINNTPWGEQHCYVLSDSAGGTPRSKRFAPKKEFHISPFMAMDVRYDWRFTKPGDTLVVHMENSDKEAKIFDATLSLRREPMTSSSLNKKLLTYPLASTQVIARIYWQALKLFLKGCPLYSHPANGKTLQETRSP